jgi:hypothetical protein
MKKSRFVKHISVKYKYIQRSGFSLEAKHHSVQNVSQQAISSQLMKVESPVSGDASKTGAVFTGTIRIEKQSGRNRFLAFIVYWFSAVVCERMAGES